MALYYGRRRIEMNVGLRKVFSKNVINFMGVASLIIVATFLLSRRDCTCSSPMYKENPHVEYTRLLQGEQSDREEEKDSGNDEVMESIINNGMIMRKVRGATADMWKAVDYEMKKLKKLSTEPEEFDAAIDRLKDRYLHIDAYLDIQKQADEVFLEDIAVNAQLLVQHQIQELQNPPNCSEAFFQRSIADSCGFGCVIEQLLEEFVEAVRLKRTFVYDFQERYYGQMDLSAYFHPVSSSCADYHPTGWTPYKSDELSRNVRLVMSPSMSYINPTQHIPKDILPTVDQFHGYPYIWWSGHLLRYLLREKPWINTHILDIDTELESIVGVHVRRSDKLSLNGEQAAYHSLAEYMKHVDDWYRREEIKRTLLGKDPNVRRRVYLATDDPSVWKEARQNYRNYTFYGNEKGSERATNERTKNTHQGLTDIIVDIAMLSHSHYVVCTLSSEICKITYQLMQVFSTDASASLRSLDTSFRLEKATPPSHLAIFDHVENAATNEIALKVGDRILFNVDNDNGYYTGRNTRTGEIGFYPSYKVEFMLDAFEYDERK